MIEINRHTGPSDVALERANALKKRAAASPGSRIRVVVGLSEPVVERGSLESANAYDQRRRSVIAQRQESVIAALGQNLRARLFSNTAAIAVDADAAAIDVLMHTPSVQTIETQAYGVPALIETIPQIGADAVHADGKTGSGRTVAVIDTGVVKTATGLSGKVVAEACFSENQDGTTLCAAGSYGQTVVGSGGKATGITFANHGTHVAAAAVSSSALGKGVAPGATLMAIQAVSQWEVSGFSRDVFVYEHVLDALDHVYANRHAHSIAAVNMSFVFGTFQQDEFYPGNCDSQFPVLSTKVNQLHSAGIVVVAASGNSGQYEPGMMPAPACVSNVVSVASVSKGDTFADYSNYNAGLDFLAPGGLSTSSSTQIYIPATNSYTSGTSIAAPHVAGAFAVLRAAYPTASVAQLMDQLKSTGEPKTVYFGNPTYGYGPLVSVPRIDLEAAVETPSTPDSLQVNRGYCYGSNDLSWASASGTVTHYELEGAASSSFAGAMIYYSGVATSFLADVSGTTYFRVRACNGIVCSPNKVGFPTATYTAGCM